MIMHDWRHIQRMALGEPNEVPRMEWCYACKCGAVITEKQMSAIARDFPLGAPIKCQTGK